MKEFVEQEQLYRVLDLLQPYADIQVLTEVSYKNVKLPIYGVAIGSKDKSAPTFGLFAGVHGLEKIGSHIVINYLQYIANELAWNQSMQKRLSESRVVCIPIVNPLGMYHNRRSTMSGVDIIRNGPDNVKGGFKNLVSGHRISPQLPWFMGKYDDEMAIETKTLIDFVKKEMFFSQFSMSLDIHSGFGFRDRLWFPYSKTKERFPFHNKTEHFKKTIKAGMPFHIYKIEPQSQSYLIDGDPWDHLFDSHFKQYSQKKIFIPWTLEMGSWLWIRKNPLQIFSSKGLFNPVVSHRYKRVLRRHRYLLNYFHAVINNWQSWQKLKV